MSNASRRPLTALEVPSPIERWAPRRLALVLLAVIALVVSLAGPSVAFAATSEIQLRFACAQKSNELLRVASATGDCRPKQETPVAIWPGPTSLCIQPDGSVRRFTSTKACTGMKPPGTIIVVPSMTPVYFCAPSSGVLRRVSGPTSCSSTEQLYVISNHNPSDLALSNSSVLENEPAGTTVGTFSTSDEDPAITPTYSRVAGTGSTDNASFTIAGAVLKTAATFDYETRSSYSIRVRVTDGYGGIREEVFTIQVLDVVGDTPPTAADDETTLVEDSEAVTIAVLGNDTDPDGGAFSVDSITPPEHGSAVITPASDAVTYTPDAGYCNDGDPTDDFTYTLAPGGSTATVAVTVTCVDDLPAASDDTATVDEDAAATAIDVLDNDVDSDGDPLTIASVVQPSNGTVVVTGGGTGLTYEPNADYCNTPPGDAPDVFTYTLTPGDSNAMVSVDVTCIADDPVADDETFDGTSSAIGNTALVIDDPTDGPPTVAGPHLVVTGDLLDGDTDGDAGTELAIEPGTYATDEGGEVTIQADGDVVFRPAAGCTDTSDGFDYTVTDQGAGDPRTDTGHVTIAITGCVWYVSNDAAGNSGTSTAPFDTIAQANSATPSGNAIFVFEGDGTTTGYTTTVTLDAGQQLIGEAADLVVLGRQLHDGHPADRPKLTTAGFWVVVLGVGNVVAGLELQPAVSGGGIEGSATSGDARIDDVHVVDDNPSGFGRALNLHDTTGVIEISNLIIDVPGTGIAIADAAKVHFESAGTVSVTASRIGVMVHRTDLGGSEFDSVTVDAGISGVLLNETTGNVMFHDLDLTVRDAAQPAFRLISTDPVTVPAGGTANLKATNGSALEINGSAGSSLAFDEVTSTGSSTHGIYIGDSGTGTFSATSGELSGSDLPAFRLSGGSGDVSYGGAISDGTALNNVEISGRTGGTVTMSGPVTDGPDDGGGIWIAGNSGGSTVISGATKQLDTGVRNGVQFSLSDGHALSITGGNLDVTTTSGVPLSAATSGSLALTGAGNTLESTTGIGLSIGATDIAAAGVTVESVSVDGAASGIVLNNTGTAGRLVVTGSGDTTQGGDASGGTIQNTTAVGIDLTSTLNPSFTNLRIEDTASHGVRGVGVNGFTFRNGTITGAGDAASEDGISFTGSATTGLTGTIVVTGNVITEPEAFGLRITNAVGTIANATITGNRLSDTGLTTPGNAILLSAGGTSTLAATVTKATISGNTISGFGAGTGIEVVSGNVSGGPAATLGIPGSATDVVTVSGNLMDGGDGGLGNQPEQFIRASAVFGVANVSISSNGTAALPIRHIDCETILVEASGDAEMTANVANNIISAGNRQGCTGIMTRTVNPGVQDGPVISATVTGNSVAGVRGAGIAMVSAATGGELTARVLNNTVAASLGGEFSGIRAFSGLSDGSNAATCLEIVGNITAGGTGDLGTAPGISLSKRGVDPAVNVFGIEGLAPSPAASPVVEQHVNSLNSSTSGTLGVGGTLLESATSGFTSCVAP